MGRIPEPVAEGEECSAWRFSMDLHATPVSCLPAACSPSPLFEGGENRGPLMSLEVVTLILCVQPACPSSLLEVSMTNGNVPILQLEKLRPRGQD